MVTPGRTTIQGRLFIKISYVRRFFNSCSWRFNRTKTSKVLLTWVTIRNSTLTRRINVYIEGSAHLLRSQVTPGRRLFHLERARAGTSKRKNTIINHGMCPGGRYRPTKMFRSITIRKICFICSFYIYISKTHIQFTIIAILIGKQHNKHKILTFLCAQLQTFTTNELVRSCTGTCQLKLLQSRNYIELCFKRVHKAIKRWHYNNNLSTSSRSGCIGSSQVLLGRYRPPGQIWDKHQQM